MFRVAAENLSGCGPYSDASDGTKASDPVTPPSQPGKPNVMEVSYNINELDYIISNWLKSLESKLSCFLAANYLVLDA